MLWNARHFCPDAALHRKDTVGRIEGMPPGTPREAMGGSQCALGFQSVSEEGAALLREGSALSSVSVHF